MKKEIKKYYLSEWADGWQDVSGLSGVVYYDTLKEAREARKHYISHHGLKPENVAIWCGWFDADGEPVTDERGTIKTEAITIEEPEKLKAVRIALKLWDDDAGEWIDTGYFKAIDKNPENISVLDVVDDMTETDAETVEKMESGNCLINIEYIYIDAEGYTKSEYKELNYKDL